MGKSNGSIAIRNKMGNELFFNELCLENDLKTYSIIENLTRCYLRLKDENFSVCRIDVETKEKLLNYLKNIPGVAEKTITSFFYSFFRAPFEIDDRFDETADDFLAHDLVYNNEQATGLTWAYVFDTLAISLLTDEKWDCANLEVSDRANSDKKIIIHHVSTVKNIEELRLWLDSHKECILLKTSISPIDKRCSLRDDHGKDILQDFWNNIRKSEYVEECINSLPYNRGYNKFIKTVKPNGIIELVLNWTDKRVGMVLQTTGRNIRETQKIAEILSERYSK